MLTSREKDRQAKKDWPLIHSIANRFRGCDDYEELFAAASHGYSKAQARFDPSKGYQLSSFAVPYMTGEIRHYLRDCGKRPRVLSQWKAIYNRCWKLSDTEAAEQENIGIDLWQEIKLACTASMVNIEAVPEPMADYSDHEDELPLLNESIGQLAEWLESLEERERSEVERVLFQGQPLNKAGRVIRGALEKMG